MKEICTTMRKNIDQLFGEDTSQMMFGDSLSWIAISDFFQGIVPFIKKTRTEKISKYTSLPKKKVML
jgi:hypothetical protein